MSKGWIEQYTVENDGAEKFLDTTEGNISCTCNRAGAQRYADQHRQDVIVYRVRSTYSEKTFLYRVKPGIQVPS
jgi:hypothetical protein